MSKQDLIGLRDKWRYESTICSETEYGRGVADCAAVHTDELDAIINAMDEPDGWVMMPRVATQEMIEACQKRTAMPGEVIRVLQEVVEYGAAACDFKTTDTIRKYLEAGK